MKMKSVIDSAIEAENFNGKALFRDLEQQIDSFKDTKEPVEKIRSLLVKKEADEAILAILRFCFLIELVKKPKIETTKFEVRWADRLGKSDVRYATFNQCMEMFSKTLQDLASAIEQKEKKDLLLLIRKHRLVPYELPLDYSERKLDEPIHRAENVKWLWDEGPQKTIRLRHFLLSEANDGYQTLFNKAYKNKIKVKTYLTDRVLTGDHKTNREKRWETHPKSVHFASRKDCLDIERCLIEQLCYFDGFPKDLFGELKKRNLIDTAGKAFRCPVTMDPLSFAEFEREILNPDHGRAAFQVGHLNPLKAINDDPQNGHTARNISWISFDGNRIQGSLSLKSARDLILKISANYKKQGIS